MRNFSLSLFAILFVITLVGCSSTPALAPSTSQSSSSSSTSFAASSSSDRTSPTADTVFGFPEQYDVQSGSGSNLGTVAVFRANSSDCTVDNLELWCNQYLRWGVDNWAVIEFNDKPGYGVYGNGSIIEVGVQLKSDHSLGDDTGADFYVFTADDVTSDGHLSGARK